MAGLPNCNCVNCQRWVAYVAPPALALTPAQIAELNHAYEADRARWLTNSPKITRDQVAVLEGEV